MIEYILDHIIEILAILVALIIFYFQRLKKSISYSTLTSSEVISISDKVKANNKIQISYLGKPVSNLQLLEIRVKNTGNLPIRPDDYIEPLTVKYPNTSSLISVEVVDQQSLGVNILSEESDTTKTIISKTLLNPNDFFDIRIIFGEGSRDFSITGRIVGLSNIQTSSNRRLLMGLKPSSLVYISIIYIMLILASVNSGNYSVFESIGIISGVFLIAFTIVALNKFLESYDKKNDK